LEDADFTGEFCRFIQSTIPNVEAAELLIALARRPEAELGPAAALRELSRGSPLSEAQAADLLETFQARGLASRGAGGFRYAPVTSELRAHAEMLAHAYNQRPVTLIRIIYALRDTRIQSFAEAFRLRKRR
jgi:DNA-binding IclR family transcriptional regulator